MTMRSGNSLPQEIRDQAVEQLATYLEGGQTLSAACDKIGRLSRNLWIKLMMRELNSYGKVKDKPGLAAPAEAYAQAAAERAILF